MSSAPGASSASAAAKERRAAADEEKAAKKRYKGKKVDTTTVEEVIDPGELEGYFEQGEWKPAWGNVEFVSTPPLQCVSVDG
jgi:hypothetical protein